MQKYESIKDLAALHSSKTLGEIRHPRINSCLHIPSTNLWHKGSSLLPNWDLIDAKLSSRQVENQSKKHRQINPSLDLELIPKNSAKPYWTLSSTLTSSKNDMAYSGTRSKFTPRMVQTSHAYSNSWGIILTDKMRSGNPWMNTFVSNSVAHSFSPPFPRAGCPRAGHHHPHPWRTDAGRLAGSPYRASKPKSWGWPNAQR